MRRAHHGRWARLAVAIVTVVAVCGTVGCATRYHPANFFGGYIERPSGAENEVVVTFAGNGYTGLERTRVYLLYRCAEVALERRAAYFQVVSSSEDLVNTGAVFTDNSVNYVHKPYATATIRFLKYMPKGRDDVFEVKRVMEDLGPYIRRPKSFLELLGYGNPEQ